MVKMFSNTLDSYAHFNGLKDANTYFKVFFAIITLLVSLISTSPIVPLIIAVVMSILIVFKAKISLKFYLKFLTIPLIFAFITFIYMAILFGVGTHILDLGLFNLAITSDGFNLGFLVFARMMGCFTCLAFLALTTPMNELFSVLEIVKIPQIVLEIAMLMYRYIFLFLSEAINMYHSQETRLGYISFKKSFKSMGILGSNLFIRTWIKGEQSYVAMESRCYNGTIKSIKEPDNIRNVGMRNIVLLVIFELSLFVGVYMSASFRIF